MNIEKIKEYEKLADDYVNEVCFDSKGNLIPELCWSDIYLIKFSELVRADEREACARVCERLTQHALGISNIDLRNAAWFIRNGRTK